MNNNFTTFSTPNTEVVLTLDVSPDGKAIAIGQQADYKSKMALSLWSLDNHHLIETLTEQQACLAARFSPSGRLIAYSDADQNMVIHNLQSGAESRETFRLPFTKWISFAWNRDRVISGGIRTQVWDAERDTVIWTLPVRPLPAQRTITPPCCALSPDGVLVAASGVEVGRIVMYDVESGEIVGKVEKTMDEARSMAFDPSGQLVAAVAVTGGVGVWDIESGEAMLPDLLNMRADYYWCVRFHPDGKHIAFGLWSGFVEVIRINDGEYAINQDAPVHYGRVRDLAITRDGKRMFTAGDDGAILIWKLG
jgi:WD40 repeat protein